MKEVDDSNFEAEVLQSALPAVLFVCATWCGPSRQVRPIVEAMADNFADRANFYQLDVDIATGTIGKYGIRSTPHIIIFKNGEKGKYIAGGKDRDFIKNFINREI